MKTHKMEQVSIASKAIKSTDFDSLAQMQRYRRLIEKYHNTPLILLGCEVDFINLAITFKHLDRLDVSGVCKLAALENIFTTFKRNK